MALRWNWNEKIGELDIEQGENKFTLSIYQGNALMIILQEWEDDQYSMYQFFADKAHFKNCQKDTEWNYCEEWRELRLWKKPTADLWLVIEDLAKRGINVRFVSQPKGE
jgi:hypothetical protein